MTDTSASSERRWRAAPDRDILWADWDGDHIAFHRPSGKTHLLNDVSKTLLTRFLAEPRSSREVVARLIDSEVAEPEPEFAADVMAMLVRFEQLGLVERV